MKSAEEKREISTVNEPSESSWPVRATAMPPTMPRVSVVIPARNEAANLPSALPMLPADLFEVILVDGHGHAFPASGSAVPSGAP
jgi:cellulose synthase/poly-beta-1,6-N-acetylglucosamine synthase-like glycosyltransferase